MKKFLAKSVLFTITSLILASVNPLNMAFAERTIDNPLSHARENPCIQELKPNGTRGDDEGYIITIMEEPLGLEESKTKTSNKDPFESRICYRNYYSYTGNVSKETYTFTELSRKCDAEAANAPIAGITNPKFSCQRVQVLLSKGGTTMIEGYISTIYKWAASIVGLIAVLVIIISAAQISLGGGDTTAIDEAKKRIITSLTGIAVLFLSGLILYTINPNFFTLT